MIETFIERRNIYKKDDTASISYIENSISNGSP